MNLNEAEIEEVNKLLGKTIEHLVTMHNSGKTSFYYEHVLEGTDGSPFTNQVYNKLITYFKKSASQSNNDRFGNGIQWILDFNSLERLIYDNGKHCQKLIYLFYITGSNSVKKLQSVHISYAAADNAYTSTNLEISTFTKKFGPLVTRPFGSIEFKVIQD